MITLTKQENLEIFECLLTIKEQDKQNPLIAVLLLAKELEEKNQQINPQILQEILFPIFPIQYCNAILKNFYDDNYFKNYGEYKLTEKGIEASKTSILWKEKTGIYHITKSDTSLIETKIIEIKEIKSNKDFDKNATNNLPYSLVNIKNYPIENGTKIISEIKSGFRKETKKTTLNAIISNIEITYTIDGFPFQETQQLKNENEFQLLCGFLDNNQFEYKVSNNEIRIITEFNENDLCFNRKILIRNPRIKSIAFDDFTIELKHVPIDIDNAQKWFEAIIVNKITEYFTDDQSFMKYAITNTEAFEKQFKLKVPSIKRVIEILKNKENNFYKIAKLETINYLNF